MIQAFDSDTCELAANYKAAVAAAIPDNVVCPLPAFWHKLAEVVAGYFSMVERRARRSPKLELERGRRIKALVDELDKELREVCRDHPLWGGVSRPVLAVLPPVKGRAASHADRYEVLVSRHFRSRADGHREFLYWGVLNLWCHELGQELRYSRDGDGTLSGPLIRFFAAVVGPVLGAGAPKPRGIAKIVDRAKADRGVAQYRARARRGHAPFNRKK